MERLILYSAEICPFAQRTRIALALKRVPFEMIEVDLSQDPEPAFLELNPEGAVPVIVHRGRAIYESSVANEYLEEAFPEPALFPADPWCRAMSRVLIDWCNRAFIPPFYELLMNQDRSRDGALREAVLDDFRYLEARLSKWNPAGTYVWDEFGMADLAYAPFFRRFVLLEHYRGLRLPETAGFRRVRRWFDALAEHPVVESTSLPDADYIRAYEGYSRGTP